MTEPVIFKLWLKLYPVNTVPIIVAGNACKEKQFISWRTKNLVLKLEYKDCIRGYTKMHETGECIDVFLNVSEFFSLFKIFVISDGRRALINFCVNQYAIFFF